MEKFDKNSDFSRSVCSNSLSDFAETVPLNTFELFEATAPRPVARSVSSILDEVAKTDEQRLEDFLFSSAYAIHEIIGDVLTQTMSTIHENELKKLRDQFVLSEIHNEVCKGIDLDFVRTENFDDEEAFQPDEEPPESFIDSWSRAAKLEEIKQEELNHKSNLARSQALDKSNKFLNEVQEKDLPKPFFISEREEENNVEEEKMRKVKEKQNQMEKEEQERRRNNKIPTGENKRKDINDKLYTFGFEGSVIFLNKEKKITQGSINVNVTAVHSQVPKKAPKELPPYQAEIFEKVQSQTAGKPIKESERQRAEGGNRRKKDEETPETQDNLYEEMKKKKTQEEILRLAAPLPSLGGVSSESMLNRRGELAGMMQSEQSSSATYTSFKLSEGVAYKQGNKSKSQPITYDNMMILTKPDKPGRVLKIMRQEFMREEASVNLGFNEALGQAISKANKAPNSLSVSQINLNKPITNKSGGSGAFSGRSSVLIFKKNDDSASFLAEEINKKPRLGPPLPIKVSSPELLHSLLTSSAQGASRKNHLAPIRETNEGNGSEAPVSKKSDKLSSTAKSTMAKSSTDAFNQTLLGTTKGGMGGDFNSSGAFGVLKGVQKRPGKGMAQTVEKISHMKKMPRDRLQVTALEWTKQPKELPALAPPRVGRSYGHGFNLTSNG